MDVTQLRALIAAENAEIHTTLPGVIVDYDGQFATVRPTLDKQLANGEVLPAPQIARVPVCWPCADVNGAQALFTMPLKAGDPVMLNFSERGLDSWLGGQDGAPDDPRQFDLSDAFATPMLRPGNMTADTENVSMQYGPMTLKITPEGEVTLDTQAPVHVTTSAPIDVNSAVKVTVAAPEIDLDAVLTNVLGNLFILGYLTTGTGGSGTGARMQLRGPVEVIDGDLTVPNNDVVAGTISLRNHLTSGVTAGGDISNTPVP